MANRILSALSLGAIACSLGLPDVSSADELSSIPRGYQTGWQTFGELDGGCDGHVRVARRGPDGNIYLAGSFQTCGGTLSPGLIRYHPASNSFQPFPAAPEGAVLDLTWFQGDLVVGGFSLNAPGGSSSGLLRWTGSAWSVLGDDAAGALTTGNVRSLAVHEGDLIAGGTFFAATGQGLVNIARWNGVEWSSLGEGLGRSFVSSDRVAALAVHNGALIAAGQFFHSGDTAGFGSVARWNGVNWQPIGWLGASVASLLVDGGGALVAGGAISAGGGPVFQVRRWSGSAWTALAPDDQTGFDVPVDALALHQGALIAAGSFSRFGTTPTPGLARWTGSSWEAHPGTGEVSPGSAHAILSDGESLYAAGEFDAVSARGLHRIARLDGTWHRLGPITGASGIDGSPRSLLSDRTRLVAVGDFYRVGDRFAPGVALWQGENWQRLGLAAPDAQSVVSAVAVYQGDVYVASDFVTPTGKPLSHGIARWRGEDWEPVRDANDIGIDSGSVHAMRVFDGELVVVGYFVLRGHDEPAAAARWNGSRWTVLEDAEGVSLPAGPMIRALEEHNGRLFVGGDFSSVGDQPASGLAYWDGQNWTPIAMGFNTLNTGQVYALAVWQGELYAAGQLGFDVGLARLQGNQWQPLATGLPSQLEIRSLASLRESLWIGGAFTSIAGTSAVALARWDGASFHAVPGTIEPTQAGFRSIWTLAPHEEELIVGGHFRAIAGQRSAFVARLQPDLLNGVDMYLQVSDVQVDSETGRIHYRAHLGNRGDSAASPASLTSSTWPAAIAISWTCSPGAFSTESCPVETGMGFPSWTTALAPRAEFYLDITLDAAPETVVQQLRMDLVAPPVSGADNRAATGLTVTTALADEVLFVDGFESAGRQSGYGAAASNRH
jgi:hypothetical protein